MPGNFSQFGVRERGYSDIVSPAAPVASAPDSSGAAIAQGIAALAGAGLDLYKMNQEQQENELAAQALAQQKEQFGNDLMSVAAMFDQHGAESPRAKDALTKLYNNSELPFDVRNDMLIKFQKTALGKSFKHETLEQQALKQEDEALLAQNLLYPGQTEEEVEKIRLTHRANSAENAARAQRMLRLEEDTRTASGPKAKQAKEALLEEQRSAAVSESIQLYTNTETRLKGLREKYLTQGFDSDPTSNEVLYKQQVSEEIRKAKFNSSARAAQLGPSLETQANFVSDNLDELETLYLDNFSSQNFNEVSSNLVGQITSSTELSILNSDASLPVLAAANKLTGYSNAALGRDLKRGVYANILNIAENEIINFSPKSDNNKKVVKETLATIGNFLNAANNPSSPSNPSSNNSPDKQPTPEEVDKPMSAVLSWLGQNPEADNSDIVKFLAGQLENSKLTAADVRAYFSRGGKVPEGVTESLELFRDRLFDQIGLTSEEELRPNIDSTLPPTRTEGVSMDELDIVAVGDRIEFRAQTPNAQLKARSYNKMFGRALTTYYTALTSVVGTSLSERLEADKQQLWPEKYSTNQPTTPEKETVEQQPSQDFSMYEGQLMQDEEGNRFLIVDGQPVAQN